jgi:hypothetical protein
MEGNSMGCARASWSVADGGVAQIISEGPNAMVKGLEIGETTIAVRSSAKSATTRIESVARFSGEWVGAEISVLEDGDTETLPIGISLRKRNRSGGYYGHYRWLNPDMESDILIASVRIDGQAAGSTLSFDVPSLFGQGQGQLVLWGDTLIGELIIPDDPKRKFTVTRQEGRELH